MGFSSKHASSVALELKPNTGYITSQYHVVFDDWFATIATTLDSLPDFNSPQWSQLFGNSSYQYIGDDDAHDESSTDPDDNDPDIQQQLRHNVSAAMEHHLPTTPLPTPPPPLTSPPVSTPLTSTPLYPTASTPHHPPAVSTSPLLTPHSPIPPFPLHTPAPSTREGAAPPSHNETSLIPPTLPTREPSPREQSPWTSIPTSAAREPPTRQPIAPPPAALAAPVPSLPALPPAPSARRSTRTRTAPLRLGYDRLVHSSVLCTCLLCHLEFACVGKPMYQARSLSWRHESVRSSKSRFSQVTLFLEQPLIATGQYPQHPTLLHRR